MGHGFFSGLLVEKMKIKKVVYINQTCDACTKTLKGIGGVIGLYLGYSALSILALIIMYIKTGNSVPKDYPRKQVLDLLSIDI